MPAFGRRIRLFLFVQRTNNPFTYDDIMPGLLAHVVLRKLR